MKKTQIYRLASTEPYVRKTDGKEILLKTWTSVCPVCGGTFAVKTGIAPRNAVNRRCPDHKMPGRRVGLSVVFVGDAAGLNPYRARV